MLILMYLLDRIIMILILMIMTMVIVTEMKTLTKKSIKEIKTTVYGDSVYINFPQSWRPLVVEPISKNSMMVAQLKTQKRTKRKTWQKRGIKI